MCFEDLLHPARLVAMVEVVVGCSGTPLLGQLWESDLLALVPQVDYYHQPASWV